MARCLRCQTSRPTGIMDTDDASSSSSLSHLSQKLSRLTTRTDTTASSASSAGAAAGQAKGDFGLNTLYVPPCRSAIADLVFVHGLGGGSRSTWTHSGDPALYWPLEWLPQDDGFQDVRIHSFGYDSNWGKESILNVHDFANALLVSILDCPHISWTEKVCSSTACPLEALYTQSLRFSVIV